MKLNRLFQFIGESRERIGPLKIVFYMEGGFFEGVKKLVAILGNQLVVVFVVVVFVVQTTEKGDNGTESL